MFGAKSLTGVSATLTADHRGREGRVHGHTWEITVWFDAARTFDAALARHCLDEVIQSYQGKCLPDRIAWGEPLAAEIARDVANDFLRPVQVDVTRQAERIYARWVA